MKLIIFYQKKEFRFPKINEIFLKIKNLKDKIIETENKYEHLDLQNDDILIKVQENVSTSIDFDIPANEFRILVNNHYIITQNLKNIILTNENFLEETMYELIVMLLGYNIVILKGFTVKETSKGIKSKPEIEILVKNKPFLNTYGSLKLVRKDCPELDSNNISECFSINPILFSLLKKGNLSFKDSTENEFLLFMKDESIFIKSKDNDSIIYEKLYHSKVKNELKKFFEERKDTLNEGFRDAFLNEELNTNINEKFNIAVKKICKRTRRKEFDSIYDLLNILPYYEDHRNNYYLKLLKQFKKIESLFRNLKERSVGGRKYNPEYLSVSLEKNIDRSPVCSLKKFCN